MNAKQFLKEIQNFLHSDTKIIPTLNEPIRLMVRDAIIRIMLRPEDCSLYVEIQREKYVYFFNFGKEENSLYDGDKTPLQLEVVEDLFDKIECLFSGKPFPTKVTVVIDLPENLIYQIAMLAHEEDITFNQYVENILREFIISSVKPRP